VTTAAAAPTAGSAGRAGEHTQPGYGADAAALADRIPGCDPRPADLDGASRLGLPNMPRLFAHVLSAVTCALQGRTALLLTFRNAHDESVAAAPAYAMTAYYAAGPGWLAVPADLSEPVGQQSIVQDVALALGGQIMLGRHAPRAST
jgi:hypothetical protein